MPVTPQNCWSLSIENLRRLVAACPSWQAATRTANAVEAMQRVYAIDLPPIEDKPDDVYSAELLETLRPFAMVDTLSTGGRAMRRRKIADGVFDQAGPLILSIECNINEADAGDPASAKIRFLNFVGALIDDMVMIAGTDDHLNVVAIAALTDALRTAEESIADIGDCFVVHLQIDYGV